MSAAGKNRGRQHEAYLNLGSNIDPEANLAAALKLLAEGGEIRALSSIWKSPAIGSPGPDFLNLAVQFITPLSRSRLKSHLLLRIEKALGRVRTKDKFAPRTIDLDVSIFDGELVDPELWGAAHIAVPLAEIHPSFTRASDQLTIAWAAKVLSDTFPITRHKETL